MRLVPRSRGEVGKNPTHNFFIMAACVKRKNVRSTEKKDQLARSYKDIVTDCCLRQNWAIAGKRVGINPTHNYFSFFDEGQKW
jgi:hypothetical protein